MPETEEARVAGEPFGTSELQLGTTHTQYTAEPWHPPEATARAEAWLGSRVRYQNQHLMGWGALNPEPRPGRYDWESLDRRLDLIRRTGGIPVLTLCCAPDWMKGGAPGRTDWSRLEAAPLPEHFDDFAELARQAALRYPDVEHFQVWNEMKGFYLPGENRWDYEGYTELYNRVYETVRSVRPEAKIGGPYVVMASWASRDRMSHPSDLEGPWGVLDRRALDVVRYWLEHSAGAGFLAVDFGTHTTDAGLVTDQFRATQKFGDVLRWLRAQTDLPIWLAEWYTETNRQDRPLEAAVMMTAVFEMARAGVAVALQWGPGANGDTCIGGCLWTDTREPEGGTPTPLAAAFDAFATAFAPGTPLFEVLNLPDDVVALASDRHVLLISQSGQPRSVPIEGREIQLRPYEVRLLEREDP